MLLKKKVIIDVSKYKQEVNIETIADKLSTLIAEKRVSTKVVSEATGISIAALNNLKRGEGNPTIGTLNSICNFFSISLVELLGIEKQSFDSKQAAIIPVFDLRNAHHRTDEKILEKKLIEPLNNIENISLFAVTVSNNFLSPFYEKGSIFILTSDHNPMDGDIVLIRMQEQRNCFKIIFIKKESFLLKNITFDESTETYNKSEIEILGVVVQIIQKTI